MKTLTITLEDKKFSITAEDSQAEEFFFDSIARLLKGNGSVEQVAEAVIEHRIETPVAKSAGYKGFLYIKCPYCGTIKGFNSKEPLGYYKSHECGEGFVMKDLAEVYANCKCGQRWMYKTNIDVEEFEMPCLECGTPIPLFWHEHNCCYQTMK